MRQPGRDNLCLIQASSHIIAIIAITPEVKLNKERSPNTTKLFVQFSTCKTIGSEFLAINAYFTGFVVSWFTTQNMIPSQPLLTVIVLNDQ